MAASSTCFPWGFLGNELRNNSFFFFGRLNAEQFGSEINVILLFDCPTWHPAPARDASVLSKWGLEKYEEKRVTFLLNRAGFPEIGTVRRWSYRISNLLRLIIKSVKKARFLYYLKCRWL